MMQETTTVTGSESVVPGVVVAEQHQIQTVPDPSPSRTAGWGKPEPSEYRCEIRLCPEREGGYSVYLPELPGVVSEGENAEESVRNIAEALRGAVRTYRKENQPIPWQKDAKMMQQGESRFWIVVSV